MRSLLCDPSLVEHHDAIRVADGGQSVSDDDGSATGERAVERFLHEGLVLVVEMTGCLVEDHDARVLEQQAGD